MAPTQNVYDEVAEFMAGMDPAKIISFKPSKDSQARLDYLLDKQTEHSLNDEERSELEHYLMLNRIIGLPKARANMKLRSA